MNHAVTLGKLADVKCGTEELRIHGYTERTDLGEMLVYGSDAEKIRVLAASDSELGKQLHPELPYIAAEVVWAVREEMARSVEDVLARRTRALFLNARAAIAMAPEVARLLAKELGRDETWMEQQLADFYKLAAQYTLEKTIRGEQPVAETHTAA